MGDGTLSGPYTEVQHWNTRVRWLLEHVAQAVGVDLGASGGGSSSQGTPSLTTATTSGTIAAGAASVTIANKGTTDAIVDGEIVPAGVTLSWSVSHPDTLGAISYDPQSSELLIAELRF